MQNTAPIFGKVPNVGGATLNNQNTALNGGGTLNSTIFPLITAGTNGTYVNEIRVKPMGTVATQTVVRIFFNNGSTIATATNNHLVKEFVVPTFTENQTTIPDESIYPLNWLLDNGQLPAGWIVYASISQDSTPGIHVTAIAVDY